MYEVRVTAQTPDELKIKLFQLADAMFPENPVPVEREPAQDEEIEQTERVTGQTETEQVTEQVGDPGPDEKPARKKSPKKSPEKTIQEEVEDAETLANSAEAKAEAEAEPEETSPADAKKQALSILMDMYSKNDAAKTEVRNLLKRYGVKKFAEIPEDRAFGLLGEALLIEKEFA